MTRHIEDSVLAELAADDRDADRRIDAYLALNNVFQLEDTDGSVRVLQFHLPAFLRAIHADLQHATVRDLLHVALRTLAYLMFHSTLAASFAPHQVEVFLSDIISRVVTSQEPATYKLCVWLLSIQNLDVTQQDFLPRVLETTALAILNPFNDREIETQALKGVHLIVSKHAALAITTLPTLRKWFRPVVSRVRSSKPEIRQKAIAVLQEVAQYVNHTKTPPLPTPIDEELSATISDYALQQVQTHMTYSRNQEALVLWKIVVLLLKTRITQDVDMLNDLLSVPEISMRHNDTSIRLQSMEAWRCLVDTFRRHEKDWVFKKGVVMLLVRPIMVSLDEEVMVNVLHATLTTWRVVVTALVRDFNAHCDEQERTSEAIQHNGKRWKRWLYEVVIRVASIVLQQQTTSHDSEVQLHVGKATIHDEILCTVWELFAIDASDHDAKHTPTTMPAAEDASVGSSVTTVAGGSSVPSVSSSQWKSMTDLAEHEDQVLDEELRQRSHASSLMMMTSEGNTGALTDVSTAPRLGGNLLSLALINKDIFLLLERINAAAARTSDPAVQQRYEELAGHIWDGLCARLSFDPVRSPSEAPAMAKLRPRLLRLNVEVAFGMAVSSSPQGTTISSLESQATTAATGSISTTAPPVDSDMTAADLINRVQGERGVVAFAYQLRMLLALVAASASSEELRGLLMHHKTKITHHLLGQIDTIVERQDAAVRSWIGEWDQSEPPKQGHDKRIDFAHKMNVVPCVALFLLVRIAVAFETMARDRDALQQLVERYNRLVPSIVDAVDANSVATSPEIFQFIRVVQHSVQATTLLLVQTREGHTSTSGGDGLSAARLLALSSELATHSEASEENANALLQLQRSPVRDTTGQEPNRSEPPPPVQVTTPEVKREVQHASLATGRTPGSSEAGSSASPCLLQPPTTLRGHAQAPPPSTASVSAAPDRVAMAPQPAVPTTPSRQKQPINRAARLTTGEEASEPPICAELADCQEPIQVLHRHIPQSFKNFFKFYDIYTVGNLCRCKASYIRKFGMKDAVAVVTRAIDAYKARATTATTPIPVKSPYRPRPQASPATPLLSSVSPKRPLKRPLATLNRLPVAPPPFTSPQQAQDQRKRARRSLRELSSDLDAVDTAEGDRTDSSAGSHNAKAASGGRVTFQLEGSDKIMWPGEDSQEAGSTSSSHQCPDRRQTTESEEAREETRKTNAAKLLNHLRRALHYAEIISAEHESASSESLSTAARRLEPIVEPLGTSTTVAAQLCRILNRLLDGNSRGGGQSLGQLSSESSERK